jgi:hypothetical protein
MGFIKNWDCVWLGPDLHIFRELTPWSGTLLEKLMVVQLIKFLIFCGNRRITTPFGRVRRWNSNPLQSTFSQKISWRSHVLLFSHIFIDLRRILFPSGFPTKFWYVFPQLCCSCYVSRPYHPPVLVSWWRSAIKYANSIKQKYLSNSVSPLLHNEIYCCNPNYILIDIKMSEW